MLMTSKLRKSYNNESEDCAKLLYISGPDLFSYIYGEKEPEIYELFKIFLKKRGNTFSKENIVVEEENSKIRGLILSHPVSDLKRFLINELKCIRGTKKGLPSFLITLFKMFFRIRIIFYYPRLKKDELFICNLAVFKEYRRKGIVTQLLKKSEEIAIEKGLKKLSLYVEIDNSHAKSVYEKFGFYEVDKVVFPKRYNKHNLFGFYKMIKEIGEN